MFQVCEKEDGGQKEVWRGYTEKGYKHLDTVIDKNKLVERNIYRLG